MKKIAVRLVLLGAGLAVLGAVGLAQTASKATGHWQGKIQMPERELGITVDLATSPKGVWIGSMSVLGSTAVDVPLSSITVEDTAVRFTASLPEHASFDGHLSADASSLSGKAASAAGEAEFQLTRNGEANVKVPPPSSVLSKEFEGNWEGTLDDGGKLLRVVLKLSAAADGIATATLISVDQGNKEIPATTVTIKEKQLQLEARAVSGTYSGTLGANGAIAGEWAQRTNRLPLTFKRVSSEAQSTENLDLTDVGKSHRWKVVGRVASVVEAKGKQALKLSQGPGMGLAWLDGYQFANGVIELDMLGRSQPLQGSFLGIAFRVVDAQTHDVIYFRPFNFRAADAERHSHAVQYASHPRWPWNKLRAERTGEYEKAVVPEPDGDEWFHARIVVDRPKVSVFVNKETAPCLVVNELSDRTDGSLGLWVGEGSGGNFANLKVTRKP